MTRSWRPVARSARSEPGARPTWRRLSECPRCVAYRPNLVRTACTAAIVGIVLFLINHLDQVLEGRASTSTWVDTGLSFIVPFCVANVGVLLASRREGHRTAGARPGGAAIGRTAGEGRAGQRMRDIAAFVCRRQNLRRTIAIALVVGTVYFAINQLGVVVGGQATTQVWISTALTYLVPFTVSNVGLRVGSRPLAT